MKFNKTVFLTCLLGCISRLQGEYTDTQCPDVVQYNSSNTYNTTYINDRRQDKTKFRLMQYNVEWLFLDYYSAADCPGNGCTWKNESEAQIHMDYVYDVLDTLNPDFVNFCEIEGCDELGVLQSKLGDNIYSPYLIKGTDSATGQNVGMLTKIDPLKSLFRNESKIEYPLEGSQCGYTGDEASTGVSKHYISEFRINDVDIAIIGAHLIAFPTDKSRCAKREAQASVLQTVIYEYVVQKGYEVVMMGDFNDFDEVILDMNSNIPNSKVLDILKGNWGKYANQYMLTSVAEHLPQNLRFSDWYDSDGNCNTQSLNDYSMIDHILITPGLLDKMTKVDIYHGYKEYCGKYDSDHYPVVVEFEFN